MRAQRFCFSTLALEHEVVGYKMTFLFRITLTLLLLSITFRR